jgi:hypothetical protein
LGVPVLANESTFAELDEGRLDARGVDMNGAECVAFAELADASASGPGPNPFRKLGALVGSHRTEGRASVGKEVVAAQDGRSVECRTGNLGGHGCKVVGVITDVQNGGEAANGAC